MKKSTFKKAGVAVLSMAMLLSMGAATLSVSAAAPTASYQTGYDISTKTDTHHISLPASTGGYTIYQVASAVKENGIYQYTIQDGTASASPTSTNGFRSVLEVREDKMVVTKEIKDGDTTLIGAGTVLNLDQSDGNHLHSHATDAQQLANALKLVAKDSTKPVTPYVNLTAGDAYGLEVEPGYYLVLANTADSSEPILVDVQNSDVTVRELKLATADVDKKITKIESAHNDAVAATYVNGYIDQGQQHTGLAPAGSTISYSIDTQVPAYYFSKPTISPSDGEMQLVTEMSPFVITDTASETLQFKFDVVTGDEDPYDGIKVYVANTADTTITDVSTDATLMTRHKVAGDQADYTLTSTGSNNFTITLDKIFVAQNANKKIKVVYDALLSETPNINAVSNENDVVLRYSNNYDTGKGKWDDDGYPDPEHDVEIPKDTDIYCTEFTADKFDENNKPLAGAEFELYMKATKAETIDVQDKDSDTQEELWYEFSTGGQATEPATGNYVQADDGLWYSIDGTPTVVKTSQKTTGKHYAPKMTTKSVAVGDYVLVRKVFMSQAEETQVDGNGAALADQTQTGASTVKNKYTFTGLIPGEYKLVESKVPTPDYQKADDYEFVITNDENTTNHVFGNVFTFTHNNQNASAHIDVQNFKGQRLPATGGIGTYLFTFGGAAVILMAGAMFVMYMKKREVEE